MNLERFWEVNSKSEVFLEDSAISVLAFSSVFVRWCCYEFAAGAIVGSCPSW